MATKEKKPVKVETIHDRLMAEARKELANHFVNDDGERCFNVYTYLESLEHIATCEIFRKDSPASISSLSASSVARYLWCCICEEKGICPSRSNHFDGCPILD